MKSKKGISCFLLFLFSLVILFPGYGQSASKNKQSGEISLSSVLKKCLSIGINNVVEEERSEEEDGSAEDAVCDYIMPDLQTNYEFTLGIINRVQQDSRYTNYSAEIICPPPNSLSI